MTFFTGRTLNSTSLFKVKLYNSLKLKNTFQYWWIPLSTTSQEKTSPVTKGRKVHFTPVIINAL